MGESFSFIRGTDAVLYEDLRNHYPDLYEKLSKLEESFKIEYSKFLRLICRLPELIEKDPEFKEFEEDYKTAFVDETSIYPLYAILFLSLGVDKSYWPNILITSSRTLKKRRSLALSFIIAQSLKVSGQFVKK